MNSKHLPKIAGILCLLLSINLSGTTIIPHPNIGEMAKHSEAVVLATAVRNYEIDLGGIIRYRTQFQTIKTAHGQIAENFDVQSYRMSEGDLHTLIDDDVSFEEGATYLLFLNQINGDYWRARMLSYGIFQEWEKDGEKVLVPVQEGLNQYNYVRPDGQPVEALIPYYSDQLINHLAEVATLQAEWEGTTVAAPYSLDQFTSFDFRAPPSQCTYLGGSAPWPRWQGFENNTLLPVYYHEDGDSECATANAKTQGAVTSLNASYTYIDLSDGGTHAYVPGNCNNGAAGSDFTNWVFNNLGTDRAILVQYEDPCSQIDDLVGCSGTLAIGGLYFYSSTHSHDGMDWNNAAYGYVITNNDMGGCICGSGSDYDLVMTHEITHSLAAGHIDPANGVANMNPSCCSAITTIDQQCLDYTYNLVLPVELVYFNGTAAEQQVRLNWQTKSEINNNYFQVERSVDGRNFASISQLQGAGTTYEQQDYSFIDGEPQLGINYYRLTQYDFDGHFEHSRIVAVRFELDQEQVSIFPNPVKGHSFQLSFYSKEEKDYAVQIMAADGTIVEHTVRSANRGVSKYNFSTTSFPPGIYWIRVSSYGKSWVEKMVITH